MTITWIPTQEAAFTRLTEFAPKAGADYAERRNFDLSANADAQQAVSHLSPWLRHRLLLEQDVLTACLNQHEDEAATSFVSEVFWRGYFKGNLEHKPQIWLAYNEGLEREFTRLAEEPDFQAKYDEAVAGKTGIECFDAWAQQLVETGYLHNHARMWFASIWMFTLELPWVLGADFFYRNLLDGDPASNTLSWRWVAGLHTKGKHYVARATNIYQFTDGQFNPVGQLNENPKPLTESQEFLDFPLPAPEALPKDQPYGLLVTEEDLQPASLDLPHAPTAIMGVVAKSVGERSPLVEDFVMGAMDDALQRTCNHFQVGASLVDGDDWGQALVDWAKQSEVKLIATAYAPIGPTAERLADAEPLLEEAGIKLVELSRPYDTLVWPHARKGYFALKTKIPGIVEKLKA